MRINRDRYPVFTGKVDVFKFPVSGTEYKRTNKKVKLFKFINIKGEDDFIKYETCTLVRVSPKTESKRRRRINKRKEVKQ